MIGTVTIARSIGGGHSTHQRCVEQKRYVAMPLDACTVSAARPRPVGAEAVEAHGFTGGSWTISSASIDKLDWATYILRLRARTSARQQLHANAAVCKCCCMQMLPW